MFRARPNFHTLSGVLCRKMCFVTLLDEKFFILTELETLYFHNHFMAYEVERSDNKAVVLHHDLPWHGVLHVVQKNGKKFIVEKDTSCIEDTIYRV